MAAWLKIEKKMFQVPRILHKRLVHSGEKTDVSLLQREGRLEKNVL
jgi:hypothetical protein